MVKNMTAEQGRTKEIVLFGLFTALTAIGAFIRIPVPVCPFTLQLLFTTLAGLILGSRRGALSVGLYVLLGLSGVPVFTEGGGLSYIFQPTFGYLIGFIAGAWVTGRIREITGGKSFGQILLANLSGLLVVYLFGMVYVYIINNFYLGTPIGIWPSCCIASFWRCRGTFVSAFWRLSWQGVSKEQPGISSGNFNERRSMK